MTNREFFLQRRSIETGLFEKVFQAVPGGKLDWKPEPKARTARELLGHLIGHEQDLAELLEKAREAQTVLARLKVAEAKTD